MQKHYILDTQSLFKDPGVFEFDYTPDAIDYRDIQLRQFAEAVQPTLHGMTPINTILHGPPGTGKTTCVSRIFSELEEKASNVVTAIVNCESDQTPFHVFSTIFRRIFDQQAPLSGIPTWKLIEKIATELIRQKKVLIICLDDANFLEYTGNLERILRHLLRMYENYPGVRIGVVSTINTPLDHHIMNMEPSLMSVYQPHVITFSAYEEEEIRTILHDRAGAGLYEGVIPSGILDRITAITMEEEELRFGIDLLKQSAITAERAARTVVCEEDVRDSLESARASPLIRIVHDLEPDEQCLLSYIAEIKQKDKDALITPKNLYESFKPNMKVSYPTFYTRLSRLMNLRFIDLNRRHVKGNSWEVVLRFDPGILPVLCSK